VAAVTRLVAVESVRGEPAPGQPFGPGPAAALAAGLSLAKEWGLTATNYENYVGAVDLNDRETRLHILCHLDVVGAGEGWDTDPYTAVERDGLLYGRGTDDDKGPAAAVLLALTAVKELGIPLRYNARLLLGTDEESGSGDIAWYYARHPYAPFTFSPDGSFPVVNIEKGSYKPVFTRRWAAETVTPRVTAVRGGFRINVVPPEAAAVVAGLGAAELAPRAARAEERLGVRIALTDGPAGTEVAVHGVSAHASTPEEGNNALTALLAFLAELPLADCDSTRTIRSLVALFPHGDWNGTALGVDQEDGLSGRLTLALSLFTLEAEGCSSQFDSRVPLCATAENCKQVADQALTGAGFAVAGEMDAPHHTPADLPFVQTLLDCYEHYTGRKGECLSMGGGTYVHDIPNGVAFGCGMPGFRSNLHGPNERVCIKDLLTAALIFAQCIVELCGEA
jgi:succinyl-diaminopimelate desuccinylase